MKQIVNELTGEIYEIPEENNELVKKEMNEIITDTLLDQLVQVQYLEQQIEIWKFQNKEKIKEIFKAYNVKSFKNEYIEITYVPETTRKSVDTNKLKQAGIYEEFCKESPVKESLRIKLKEEK